MNIKLFLRVQRILMCIPIANITIPFIWIVHCVKNKYKITVFLESYARQIVIVLPLGILKVIIQRLFFSQENIALSLVFSYIIPFFGAFVLIRYQERFFGGDAKW